MGVEGEVRDKPVTKPPEHLGGMEELAIKGHWGRSISCGGVPLHGGTPVDELDFRD